MTSTSRPGHSSFDEFYREHRGDAIRWAVALVGDREVAEELAQDALAAVGARLSMLDNPGGYLRRTVVNRAASWHRAHARERRRLRRATAGEPTSYTAATSEMLGALATLPYKQRAALTLRYWADWSDEQIAEARRDKESAIDEQDFEKAARLRDVEKQLGLRRTEKEKSWKNGDLDAVAEVDEELIAEVLANATGIPVFKLTEEESSRLLHMEDNLHKRVVGQDAAIKALSQAIRRTRAGLKDPKRPGGSFIFAGPTGVGKTELARALAEFLFGDEDALIQLDMSEFSEKHTVSRLFGSPPGYVGYDEGGQLTEKVRRRPFSVVLFDEVEKAHADIFNSLLQILEDGRLTDSQGRVIDFKNTVIIMTTNLGTKDITGGPVGFTLEGNAAADYAAMRGKVVEELKKHFKPEFLNRVDETIVFPQLNKEELLQIVGLFIGRLAERLLDRDMSIEVSDEAKARLIELGWDPTLGARPLRRAVQHEIEDRLSEKILHSELEAGDHVRVGFDASAGTAGEFTFETGRQSGRDPKPAKAAAIGA